MTNFVLDTNVPSELTRPIPERRVEQWLDNTDDGHLFFSVISLGEIFKGLTLLPESKRRRDLQRWIDATLGPWFDGRILPVTFAPVSSRVAQRWGILAGACQQKGRPLKVADVLIAATALEHDCTVVTRNVRDFTGLGLTIFDPWKS